MLSEFKTYSAAFDDQIDRYLTQFEYSRYGNWRQRGKEKEERKEKKKKRDKEREKERERERERERRRRRRKNKMEGKETQRERRCLGSRKKKVNTTSFGLE